MKTLSKLIFPAVFIFQAGCITTHKQYYDSGKLKQVNISRSFSLRTCHDCGKRYTHIQKNYFENGNLMTLAKTRKKAYYAGRTIYFRKRVWDESGKLLSDSKDNPHF